MPYEAECPACDGLGCPECGEAGVIRMTACPATAICRDAWEIVRAAELYDKGLAPEPGGTLDQAADFVRATRFVWSEQARCRAEDAERRQ